MGVQLGITNGDPVLTSLRICLVRFPTFFASDETRTAVSSVLVLVAGSRFRTEIGRFVVRFNCGLVNLQICLLTSAFICLAVGASGSASLEVTPSLAWALGGGLAMDLKSSSSPKFPPSFSSSFATDENLGRTGATLADR